MGQKERLRHFFGGLSKLWRIAKWIIRKGSVIFYQIPCFRGVHTFKHTKMGQKERFRDYFGLSLKKLWRTAKQIIRKGSVIFHPNVMSGFPPKLQPDSWLRAPSGIILLF